MVTYKFTIHREDGPHISDFECTTFEELKMKYEELEGNQPAPEMPEPAPVAEPEPAPVAEPEPIQA